MVESLENRLVMAAWNYTFEWSIYEDQLGDGLTAELDVDRNSNISPLDVLQVVNALNGSRAGLLHEMDSIENYRLDTNGNGYIEPLDALMIINRINLSGSETDGGEGEEDSPIKSPIKSQAYRYSEMAFAAFGTNEEILLGEKHSRRNTRR